MEKQAETSYKWFNRSGHVFSKIWQTWWQEEHRQTAESIYRLCRAQVKKDPNPGEVRRCAERLVHDMRHHLYTEAARQDVIAKVELEMCTDTEFSKQSKEPR
uniref:Uncharacterized protein n=1 Tax=Chromera velia CCMP2878 TaxID=1169474 RepID=A0A0G4HBY3_9ALVE|eukprot:Cvel_925.t1-p1 / transcript=Cvel_925.t1 / gene=Cvel_925 / organism=Chromera_velia_CCMP2878 / gene_product=hypothetical protein / transcript_product=hypothetical protein / location=Cvel_scaffold29:100358-100660(-) / protein_length=101 / sequence_SO=supercontig / SO=protein_coding / is_pseudo=false